jgi:hypothetical protein
MDSSEAPPARGMAAALGGHVLAAGGKVIKMIIV